GQLLTPRIDGRALPIDPGVHEFSFETEKGVVVATQKLVILQGQRNRALNVSLGHAAGKAPERMSEGAVTKASQTQTEATLEKTRTGTEAVPDEALRETQLPERKARSALGTYLLLGTGVAGLTSYAVLTYWGNRDNDDLKRLCAPRCDPALVDHIHNMYLGANISLGVGIPALIAGGWLAWKNRS